MPAFPTTLVFPSRVQTVIRPRASIHARLQSREVMRQALTSAPKVAAVVNGMWLRGRRGRYILRCCIVSRFNSAVHVYTIETAPSNYSSIHAMQHVSYYHFFFSNTKWSQQVWLFSSKSVFVTAFRVGAFGRGLYRIDHESKILSVTSSLLKYSPYRFPTCPTQSPKWLWI